MTNPMSLLVASILFALLSSNSAAVLAQRDFKTNLVRGTMYINEEYLPLKFSRIIVFTSTHDKEINSRIMSEFSKIGIVAFNGFQVFPPIKEYSDEDRMKVYLEQNIDGTIWTEVKNKTAVDETIRMDIELTVRSATENITAIAVFGRGTAYVSDPDWVLLKFFEAVINEWPGEGNQETP